MLGPLPRQARLKVFSDWGGVPMKSSYAFCACLMLAVTDAGACGMSSTAVPFETDGTQLARDAPSGELPAPPAVVTGIVRGIGSNHETCNDTGLVTVMIEWPRSKYKLRDVGFEFVAVGGSVPYVIFPEGPVQGREARRRSEFLFLWRDGPPSQQKRIDMQVDVRAVTRDNQRGPATRLRLGSPAGG